MLVFEESEGILRLRDFEREKAIAFLEQGLPIILVCLDRIYQDLEGKLK
jgi:hypothetical protein